MESESCLRTRRRVARASVARVPPSLTLERQVLFHVGTDEQGRSKAVNVIPLGEGHRASKSSRKAANAVADVSGIVARLVENDTMLQELTLHSLQLGTAHASSLGTQLS